MNGRGLKIALGVSLAINVFAIGGIAGALYMRAQSAVMHGGPAEALSPADRDAFRQMIRAQIPTLRPLQQDARQARHQAMTLLQAPTFDRAAVAALMARARADDQQARSQMEGAVLDFAARIPASERSALMHGLHHGAMQHWRMHGGPDGGPPPPPDGPESDAPPPEGPR